MPAPDATLLVRIAADASELARQFNAGERHVKSFSERVTAMGSRLVGMGRSMTIATLPITIMGGMAIRTAAEFEASMNKVQALTGATGDAFSRLRAQAMELGATTKFTASEAASAMSFLGMAGFETNQILAAMPSTLQLAAAAAIDLGTAADITSNILTGYRLPVTQLTRANDVLVATFTATNTNLQQLGEAMKYVGPIGSAVGAKFEEVAAAIGLLGNAGIQGTMAGTSLRRAFSSLLNPTGEAVKALGRLGIVTTDSTGKFRPFVDIIGQLERRGASAADMLTIFGDRGGPAMAALVSVGSAALAKLTQRLEESGGTAQRIADVQMRGLKGAFLELKSAWEDISIRSITGSMPVLEGAIRGLTRAFRAMSSDVAQSLLIVAGILAASGPIMVGLGLLMAHPIIAGTAVALAGITLLVTRFVQLRAEANNVREAMQGIIHVESMDRLREQTEAVNRAMIASARQFEEWDWLDTGALYNARELTATIADLEDQGLAAVAAKLKNHLALVQAHGRTTAELVRQQKIQRDQAAEAERTRKTAADAQALMEQQAAAAETLRRTEMERAAGWDALLSRMMLAEDFRKRDQESANRLRDETRTADAELLQDRLDAAQTLFDRQMELANRLREKKDNEENEEKERIGRMEDRAGAFSYRWGAVAADVAMSWNNAGAAIHRVIQGVIRDLIAATARALIFRAIMAAFGMPVGGGLSFGGIIRSAIGLQRGGIVTKPTLGVIGEHEPEAVVPLSQFRQAGTGPVHIHLSVGDERLADIMLPRLTESIRRHAA